MKSPKYNTLIASLVLLAFPLGLKADLMSWTTFFADSLSLDEEPDPVRVAGGDPNDLFLEENGSIKIWRRNNTTAFGPNGGLVGYTDPVYGTGAANAGFGFNTSPGVGPAFGQFTSGVLRFSASVTLGSLASEGWIGLSFLGNPDSQWFGTSVNGNPFWIRLSAAGILTADGIRLSYTGYDAEDPLPQVDVSGFAGFSTTDPVEIGLSYNLDTFGLDVYFNGESVMASHGLFVGGTTTETKTDPTGLIILNGTGIYIEGSNATGMDDIPTVNSLLLEHGVAIPEPGSAALILGFIALMAGMQTRTVSRRRRAQADA